MKRQMILGAMCFLLLCAACKAETVAEPAPTQTDPETSPVVSNVAYYGSYTITDYWNKGMSAWTNEEAEKQLYTVVTYSEEEMTWNGETCELPEYETSWMTPEDFSDGFNGNVEPEELGLKNREKIHCVEVTNCDFLGGRFYIVDSDTLLIFCDGAFFTATRNV